MRMQIDRSALPYGFISFCEFLTTLSSLLQRIPVARCRFNEGRLFWSGAGPITAAMDYASASAALGLHYQESLRRRPAGRRIQTLLKLATFASADGVLQVEACPFHSPSLPNKNALPVAFEADRLLSQYIVHLREFLRERSIVIVSGIATANSLAAQTRLSPLLVWQAELAGMNLAAASFLPLVRKDSKTTCAAFLSRHASVTNRH